MVGGVAEHDVNVPQDNFTEPQWVTLKNLVLELKEQFPEAVVKGHNEVSSKACPSFDVQKWLVEKEIIKVAKITTDEEKQFLEEKREQFKKEHEARFAAQRKE